MYSGCSSRLTPMTPAATQLPPLLHGVITPAAAAAWGAQMAAQRHRRRGGGTDGGGHPHPDAVGI